MLQKCIHCVEMLDATNIIGRRNAQEITTVSNYYWAGLFWQLAI
jgi:hypothetical protein